MPGAQLIRTFSVGLAVVIVLLALACSASASSRPLQIGYGDPLLQSTKPSVREEWLQKATESGASWVRLHASWASIAPPSTIPAGFEAANPGSPAYDWAELDAAVRDANAHHLKIMLTISRAPAWAEGAGRPASIKPGAWEPNPAALGEFGHALAARYSGSFPDPLSAGSNLPRVQYFDAWNEPNLANFLAPQVSSSGKAIGPDMFRRMLNRFYAGVKSAQPRAVIAAPSSASFGAPNGFSTAPVLFLRDLLCLRGGRLKPVSCPEKAHLDVLAAHAIQVGPPTESAESPLDATTPDMGRLTAVVRAAEKAGTVRSEGRIPLWVTEFWVDSSPPDPDGIPLLTQARWYQQNLYEYWKAGAEVAIELQLRDEAPGKVGYPLTLQSGLYFLDGSPKPSQTAMHFPFVAHRAGKGRASVWGIAPNPGTVRIQALRGGSWTTLAKVHASGLGHPFSAEIPMSARGQLRATLAGGGAQSLAWKLG